MGTWTWVNDLLAPEDKKKAHNWDVRCPYVTCPSNPSLVDLRIKRPARLKFIQKIGVMTYEYRCKDCGKHFMADIAVPHEKGLGIYDPRMWGGHANSGIFGRRFY